MDWKTFISNIIGSLSWPLVVVVSVWYLKDNLGALLLRLKRLKHKDTELEFLEGVKELAEGAQPASPHLSKEIEFDRNVLQRLAGISPRSAVTEAYRMIEVAAVKAIEKAHPELAGRDIKTQVQISKKLREKVLSSERYHDLRELRYLRNTAAHDEQFSLTGRPIETYIDAALSIANELELYEP